MKALVVYGSERGGTAGLAQMIGAAFQREGWDAEVRDAGLDLPLGNADIVVVGGALYLNRWHKAARSFVRRHAGGLTQLPMWMFSSGPLDDSARAGDLAPVPQVQELARLVEARGHMTFGGRLEAGARGFLARSMAKNNSGDWRDPAQVAEWVHEIVHELTPAEVVAAAPAAVRAAIPAQRGARRRTSTAANS